MVQVARREGGWQLVRHWVLCWTEPRGGTVSFMLASATLNACLGLPIPFRFILPGTISHHRLGHQTGSLPRRLKWPDLSQAKARRFLQISHVGVGAQALGLSFTALSGALAGC